jgi:signal transduction histidine kinase
MDTHETKIYTAILIAAAILGIILVYFIITIIRHQRINLILQKEKIHAEINTLENERKRIASDLHDDLGPLLSAVKLQINNVDLGNSEDQEMIKKASMHIDSILSRIREIANNLMPQTLIRKGVIVAIKEFIDNLHSAQPFTVNFICHEEITLENENDIHLYRMVQEIVHNSMKHAQASEMTIQIRKSNNKLLILLADNGIGFDYKNVAKSSLGLGLKNLLSRVETMKGNLYIDTSPGKGTSYTIEIPS